MIHYFPVVTGSLIVSGNLSVTGTATVTASSATTASNALTASSADTFIVRNNLTGSNALFTGAITAQTLVVQTVTSSIEYATGSNRFGSQITDRQTFTGSLFITGSSANFSNQICGLMGNFSCIGIGNVTPAQKLDISSGHVKLSDGYGLFYGTQTQIYASEAAKYVRFDIAGTSGVLYLSSSGNIGIGTTTPQNKLDISDANGIPLRFGDITGSITGQTAGYIGMSTSAYLSGNNGDLVFYPRTSATSKILLMGGSVGMNTTSTSTEANLFLGAQGTIEGGQLVLQKGTSCSCATHLDNYQDSFRVLVGTDTSSNGVHFLVDHKTRNACFYGQVQTVCGMNSYYYNGFGARYNFTSLNTPQTLVGICANNGIIVIRDHTAGGTGAFLIDPNQGVICMASNIPATVAIAYHSAGGTWCWCLTSGGVPRCLGYGFYGA